MTVPIPTITRRELLLLAYLARGNWVADVFFPKGVGRKTALSLHDKGLVELDQTPRLTRFCITENGINVLRRMKEGH